jgi:hypothetical protein
MGLAGFDRNQEALAAEKARQDKTQSEFGANADMLYLLEGATMVRVLPPFSDEGVFFKRVYKHRVKVGDDVFSGLCPEKMETGDCPICARGEELFDTKDEEAIKIAKDLRARANYLYNVVVYSGPANRKGDMPENGKVYVMESGVMVHRQILELDQDEGSGWADITSPQQGVNLIIKRTGKGLDTKYSVNPHGGGRSDVFAYLKDDCKVDPTSLELYNLDEVYAFPDAEKLLEVAGRVRGPRGTEAQPTFAPAGVAPVVVAPALEAPPLVAAPSVVTKVPVAVAAPVAAPVVPAPPTE